MAAYHPPVPNPQRASRKLVAALQDQFKQAQEQFGRCSDLAPLALYSSNHRTTEPVA
jgi:hypothetical protein